MLTNDAINPFGQASLLRVAYGHALTAANAEEGFLRVQDMFGAPLDPAAFHDVVAEALAAGLIREPVVLPEGALQCHWRLDLTPAGVARARELVGP